MCVAVSGIELTSQVRKELVEHCLGAYPLEGCGLLAATAGTASAVKCYPASNAAKSARLYSIDPKEIMVIDRDADENGLEVIGVFHSHTHTDAYPSPTDVAQAPLADWHYLLVSFKDDEPVVRSYRIVDGNIDEEPVVLV